MQTNFLSNSSLNNILSNIPDSYYHKGLVRDQFQAGNFHVLLIANCNIKYMDYRPSTRLVPEEFSVSLDIDIDSITIKDDYGQIYQVNDRQYKKICDAIKEKIEIYE